MWDDKTVRKMISQGRLAPSFRGKDDREEGTEQYCPICLLHYDEINMLKCCGATICTECYLQLQDPTHQSTACPLCKCSEMKISPTKQLKLSEATKRERDEQKVIEATIQARKNSEKIAIEVPTEESNYTYPDISQVDIKSTGGRMSPIVPRPIDLSDVFDSRMQFDSVDMFENQLESHRVNQLFSLDGTRFYQNTNAPTHNNVLELSEETQIAMAIQMSLRNA